MIWKQALLSIQLFHTILDTSQKYQPQGAVDQLMNYHPRPEGDSSSGGPQHQGADSFDCCPERYNIDVLLPNSYFKGTVFFFIAMINKYW